MSNSITYDKKVNKYLDSVFKSAFVNAGVSYHESKDKLPQRAVLDGMLRVHNTALVNRSAENSDYFYKKCNMDCIYTVFNVLAEEKKLPISAIKVIREVCKMWKGIVDGVSFGFGLLQQRFFVHLTIKEQLAAFALELIYRDIGITSNECAMINREISDVDLDGHLKSRFAIERSLNIKINLFNDYDIDVFLYLINKKSSSLKNIESISFGEIKEDNVFQVQKLLDIIFETETILFSSFKKLSFRKIGGGGDFPKLMIPGFKGVESLIFGDSWGIVEIAYCPLLKDFHYNKSGNVAYFRRLEAALKLSGLNTVKFFSIASDYEKFLSFINYPGNMSKLGCLETIVIEGKSVYHVQKFLDFIYSKQDSLTGLKQIKVDTSFCTCKLPKFLERIEVVYFAGSGANP